MDVEVGDVLRFVLLSDELYEQSEQYRMLASYE